MSVDYDPAIVTPAPYSYGGGDRTLPSFSYYGPSESYLIGAYSRESDIDDPAQGTSILREFQIRTIKEDFWRAQNVFKYSSIVAMRNLAPFYPTDSGFGESPAPESYLGTGASADSSTEDTSRPLMEGNLFRKIVRTAANGLPPNDRGFLSTNHSFINKIQQRYIMYKINPSIGGDDLRIGYAHNTNYNLFFGFDNDGDGIPFEDYYDSSDGYVYAPWITIGHNLNTYARQSRFRYSVGDSALVGDVGATFKADLARALTMSDAFSGGDLAGTFSSVNTGMLPGEEELDHAIIDDMGRDRENPFLNPLTEELYSHVVQPVGGDFFFATVTGGSSLVGTTPAFTVLSAEIGLGAVLGVEREFGGGLYGGFGNPNTGDISTMLAAGKTKGSRFHPLYQSSGEIITADGEFREYKQRYYYYEESSGQENVENIRRKFKTIEYVNNFTNQFMEHKIDLVAALLTTTVTREADIKIQKNNALNYNLTSAMTDDFTTMEAPDTSVAVGTERGTDATRPRGSMRPAAMGALTPTTY